MVFHVLNRGMGRRTLFEKDGDYLAFEKVLEETLSTRPMRLCAYCLLPTHWHFVVWIADSTPSSAECHLTTDQMQVIADDRPSDFRTVWRDCYPTATGSR